MAQTANLAFLTQESKLKNKGEVVQLHMQEPDCNAFLSKDENFQLDSVRNREPVKRFKYRVM